MVQVSIPVFQATTEITEPPPSQTAAAGSSDTVAARSTPYRQTMEGTAMTYLLSQQPHCLLVSTVCRRFVPSL